MAFRFTMPNSQPLCLPTTCYEFLPSIPPTSPDTLASKLCILQRFNPTMPTEILAPTDLRQLASDVLSRALKAGATDAEAVVYEGDEFNSRVRLGQVETLKESGSRAVGLRVFIASGLGSQGANRTASTSSSDFSPESIARLVSGAVTLA